LLSEIRPRGRCCGKRDRLQQRIARARPRLPIRNHTPQQKHVLLKCHLIGEVKRAVDSSPKVLLFDLLFTRNDVPLMVLPQMNDVRCGAGTARVGIKIVHDLLSCWMFLSVCKLRFIFLAVKEISFYMLPHERNRIAGYDRSVPVKDW